MCKLAEKGAESDGKSRKPGYSTLRLEGEKESKPHVIPALTRREGIERASLPGFP